MKNNFNILSEKVSKRNIKLWQHSSRWQAHQTQWQRKSLKYGSKMTHTPVLQSEVINKPAQFILQNLGRVTWQQQLLSKPIPVIGKLQGLVNTPENVHSGDVNRKKKLLIDNFNICSITTLYHPTLVCRKMIIVFKMTVIKYYSKPASRHAPRSCLWIQFPLNASHLSSLTSMSLKATQTEIVKNYGVLSKL